MHESSDHVTAAAGDCLAEVLAQQKECEATDDPGEPVPDDVELV
jgi:hypothetical protein